MSAAAAAATAAEQHKQLTLPLFLASTYQRISAAQATNLSRVFAGWWLVATSVLAPTSWLCCQAVKEEPRCQLRLSIPLRPNTRQ